MSDNQNDSFSLKNVFRFPIQIFAILVLLGLQIFLLTKENKKHVDSDKNEMHENNSQIERMQLLIQTSPNLNNFHQLALLLLKAERTIEATYYFEKALEIDSSQAIVYNNLGASYNNLLKWQSAEKALRKSLSIDPEFALAKNNLLVTLAGKDRMELELHKLRQIVNSSPSYENHMQLGLACFRNEYYLESVEQNLKAINFDPRSSIAYSNLCASYNNLLKYDLAAAACSAALQLDSNSLLAKNNLQIAIEKMGHQKTTPY